MAAWDGGLFNSESRSRISFPRVGPLASGFTSMAVSLTSLITWFFAALIFSQASVLR